MSNSDLDHEVAIEQCGTIVTLIDEEVPEWALDKAANFFESVREGVVDMEEGITDKWRVTEDQQTALDNWEEGVRKWIKD